MTVYNWLQSILLSILSAAAAAAAVAAATAAKEAWLTAEAAKFEQTELHP